MGKFNDIDAGLAKRAARGDAAAFSELYRLHRDRVYGFAYRMVGAQTIAEDVTQEAFMVLIEHPERFRPEKGSMLTFLCAVARNHILYYLRRHRRESEDDVEQIPGGGTCSDSAGVDPLRSLLADELAAEVDAAINALPPLQREVLVLREFEELTYEEIATITGVETNVVKVRLHRARQSLTRLLAPYLALQGGSCHELL